MKQMAHNAFVARDLASVEALTAVIGRSQIVVAAASKPDLDVSGRRLPDNYGAFEVAVLDWIVAEGWRAAPGRQIN